MEYLPVLILMSAGLLIGGTVIFLSWYLGPKLPNTTKDSAFECGAPALDDAKSRRMSVRFYLIAILFLLFDVETVFFYPWAVVYRQYLTQGQFIFLEMIAFVAVLLVGYVYILRKGALEWE